MTQTRAEAMRAAAQAAIDAGGLEYSAATAGADAELARVERWAVDAQAAAERQADNDPWDHGYLTAYNEVLEAIRARAHWPKESDDG